MSPKSRACLKLRSCFSNSLSEFFPNFFRIFLSPCPCILKNFCPPSMYPSSKHMRCFYNRAQVVGWPPIRSFRKNTLANNLSKNTDVAKGNSSSGCLYVKVSMDGAPYLRKVDLKTYCNYAGLSSALEKMFSCFTIGMYSLSCSLTRTPCSTHASRGTHQLLI